MIYFRADASVEIGTGHIVRCISIAKAVERFGSDAIFLTSETLAVDMLRQSGLSVQCGQTSMKNMEEEISYIRSIVKPNDVVLVDSYFAGDVYLKQLRQYCKVAVIEDFFKNRVEADAVINYTIGSENHEYEKAKNQILCTGMRYAPVREQFQNASWSNPDNKILICQGGTGKTLFLHELLLAWSKKEEFKRLEFVVALGKTPYPEWAKEEKLENVEFLSSVKDMASLMKNTTVVVTGAGTTIYEVATVGTPFVAYKIADNQMRNIQGILDYKIGVYAGAMEETETIESIISSTKMLLDNPVLRQEFSLRERELIDGRGAERIAEEIIRLGKSWKNNTIW